MATLPVTHAMDEAPGVVAGPGRIDAWMSVARAGDRFVYASRCSLPAGSKGAAHMRALASRGLVRLHCPRSTLDPSVFNYLAIRTDVAVNRKPVRPVLAAAVVDAEAAAVDALLPLLTRAAQFGRPCPSDHQLAERSGLALDLIAPSINALRAAGLIAVHAAPRPTLRRITILATGDRTGLSRGLAA